MSHRPLGFVAGPGPGDRLREFVVGIVALLACAAAALAQAQGAGRIVLAVGDVVAVRAAERLKLAAGTLVNVGDSVVTGANSHAQIRFSDESLVALKPESEFRIESFNFDGRSDGSERAVFRLVRGGFRTVTGVIGKVNQDTYQVQTTQATIGIRGTHYGLQVCATGQCVQRPGDDPNPPGLYGGVYEGEVFVGNALGQDTYGAREFFFVPDGEGPRRWLAPPLFLADSLGGRDVGARQAPVEVNFTKVPEFELDAALPIPPFVYQGTEDLRRGRGGDLTFQQRNVVVGSDRYILELDATPHATLTRNGAGALTGFANGNLAASLGGAQLADVGSDVAGGNVNWGRWTGTGSTITLQDPVGGTISNNGGNLHYAYGDVATSLPASGQVSYAPVGGTRPTDSTSGAVGTLASAGTIDVDFTRARLTLNGLAVAYPNANYTMSGGAGIVGSLFSTAPVGATVACTGSACKPLVAGNYAGFFAGPGGAGIGLDYFFNITGGVIEGVAAYRKCPAATPRC